jgi:glycosyltransferase involved in cell wall biosynthesis
MENKISVILPIKTGKALDFEEFFDKAIKSVKNQGELVGELIIVHVGETTSVETISSYDYEEINVKVLEFEGNPNFASQVNFGVENATSEWVSILEFDDEYSNIWFKNVEKYINHYGDVGVFMPIVVDVDDKGVFVGFTNEATFAVNFSNEMGILDNETLLTYQNFQISGAVYKKDLFVKNGMIKPSFKLTFGYELFLRLTNNSVKIMTIPKIGYKHMNFRTGSIFWNYKNGEERLSEDEVRFWIDSAKKEYLYIKDRDIKYEPQEV